MRNPALQALADAIEGEWTLTLANAWFLDMTFDGSSWTMRRADPDFHQRFVADVHTDRIDARFDASDDRGATWRKDFDLVLRRA